MARKLPAPFHRPSVRLSAHGKAWQHTEVQYLDVEDLVVDKGGVKKITVSANVVIEFFSGNIEFYGLHDPVEAFTRIR